ncbi:hypothetical protein AMTR_s00024p00183000 [Amborella trichopoda]|uniref:Uncharacterized protein n=1 Tax=Amborella trichopoda TaxID=13333 RepID=W1PM97_AMBTC|nr:hypothetical protein AMTR_s00024p00183000 [Amborella trichopoda]
MAPLRPHQAPRVEPKLLPLLALVPLPLGQARRALPVDVHVNDVYVHGDFLAPGAYPTLEPDWSIPSPELLACIHGLLPVSLLFCGLRSRSFSLVFKGVWSIDIGFTLWIPSLNSKGCSVRLEEGWALVRLLFYVGLLKKYGEKVGCVGLEQEEEEEVPKKARVKLEFCANWERAAKKLCWKDKKGW